MKKATFEVPGTPVAWQRPGQRNGARYDTPRNKQTKQIIATIARSELASQGWSTPLKRGIPVALTVVFLFPQVRNGGSRHVVKPDTDNLVKLVKDALSGVAYDDDCQVCEVRISKLRWHEPLTRITIEEIE